MEAKRGAPINMIAKVAFLEVGNAPDKSIDQLGLPLYVDKISVLKVPTLNFFKYDVVVIPSGSNQDVLYGVKHRIASFLKAGGILVVFQVSTDKKPWLDIVCYDGHVRDVNFVKRDSHASQKIFGTMTSDDIKFHEWFIAHGYFTSGSDYVTELVTTTNEDSHELVAAVIENPSGTYFLTTLDPCLHSVVGYHRGASASNPKATELLRRVIGWAIAKAESQQQRVRWLRSAQGFLQARWLSLALITSCLVCLISLLCVNHEWMITPFATAIVWTSSIASTVFALIGYRRQS